MSQYIKLFNTRDEYNEWASAHTEGNPVSSYILSENAVAESSYVPFLTAHCDTTAFDYPSGTTTLHIDANLNWTINKPSWISITGLTGTCKNDLAVEVGANDESKFARNGNIVINYNQTSSQTITLTQQGNPSYTGMPDTQIWYTTFNETISNPYSLDAFGGATLLSNTYDSIGVLTFDRDITSIGWCAYQYNELTTIRLPDSCEVLDSSSFINLPYLTTIDAGTGVTNVNAFVRYSLPELDTFNLRTVTPPEAAENFLDNATLNANFKIYVPAQSVDAYKTAPNWSKYANIIEALA